MLELEKPEKQQVLEKLAVPVEMFDNPGDLISRDTKITVDLDPDSPTFGRLYGIVAPSGTCLLGDAGSKDKATCWTVDHLRLDDPDLAYAHQGDAVVRETDGSIRTIKVAVLSGDLEHSTGYMTADEAKSYIENTGTQIAAVRYHWHDLGLVMSGVLFPSALNTETVRKVLASPVSLEARTFAFSSYIATEERYRLTGAILVNMPGLPLRRASAADIGTTDLIIAGSGHVYASDSPGDEAFAESEDTQTPPPDTDTAAESDTVAVLEAEVDALRRLVSNLETELKVHAEAIASLLGV